MSASSGYGICGHKNAFSSGVKVGNYVEDRIGGALAAKSRAMPLTTVSESHANHMDPRAMPDKCKAKLDPATTSSHQLVERELLRGGLSYNLLFKHGNLATAPTCHEIQQSFRPSSLAIGAFATTSTSCGLTNTAPNQQQEDQVRRLSRELEQRKYAAARERNHGYVTTTQTHFAPSDLKPKPK